MLDFEAGSISKLTALGNFKKQEVDRLWQKTIAGLVENQDSRDKLDGQSVPWREWWRPWSRIWKHESDGINYSE